MTGHRRFIVTPLADADAERHQDWYRSERPDRPDLLDRYINALTRTIDAVAANPEHFVADPDGVRHARLRDVPYAVYFKASDDEVVVFAVMHERQNPDTWRSRI